MKRETPNLMMAVRWLSTALFYLTRVLAAGYLTTALYVGTTLLFKTSGLHIIADGTRFEVCYPFTQTPFILGGYSANAITEMLLAIALYGIFFWMLGDVINSFRQPKYFTEPNLKKLTRFYLGNWCVPILVFVIQGMIATVDEAMILIVVLHAVVGIFAFYMAAIFKQGLSLQNENDLYI